MKKKNISILKTHVLKGARLLYAQPLSKPVITRINYELQLITKEKLEDFFLILYDIVQFANINNILIGPGRGFAAASIVNYCLGITGVDPVATGLVFERLYENLIPPRPPFPMLFIDADSERIDEIKNYILNKHGRKNSALVMSQSKEKTLEALQWEIEFMRNHARRCKSKRIARLVKNALVDDSKGLDSFTWHYIDELINAFKRDDSLWQLFNDIDAHHIEIKLPSGLSSGIVITKKPFKAGMAVPVNENRASYISMEFRDSPGMPEHYYFKFIRQRSLNVISICINMIKKNKNLDVSLSHISFDDNKTYRLLAKGETQGMMEYHDPRIRKWLIKLKPGCIDQLCAIYSLSGLYIEFTKHIREYISHKKNNTEKERHPLVRTYLKDTYGMVLYQEQVVQILMAIGNYTIKDAVKAIKDIGKRKYDELKIIQSKFIKSAQLKSIMGNESDILLDDMLNAPHIMKSHTYPSAITFYRMAYLKAHFRLEFEESSQSKQ